MYITAWLHTFVQYFYIELNLLAKAIYILLCIAEQFLSTFPGTLCFCLSPVDNTMHLKVYIRSSNVVFSYLIKNFIVH